MLRVAACSSIFNDPDLWRFVVTVSRYILPMILAPFSSSALAGTDLTQWEVNHYWLYKVVGTDESGTPCMRFPNLDRAVEILPRGTSFFADENIRHHQGEKWIQRQRGDGPGCFVRANTDHVEPVREMLDLVQVFETGVLGTGYPPAFWIVVDDDGLLNCRKNLTTDYQTIVTTLPAGTMMVPAKQAYGTSHPRIEGVEYAPDTGNPWFRITLAGDASQKCYIRANSRHVRPSGQVP
jgi:hypothetical protein